MIYVIYKSTYIMSLIYETSVEFFLQTDVVCRKPFEI